MALSSRGDKLKIGPHGGSFPGCKSIGQSYGRCPRRVVGFVIILKEIIQAMFPRTTRNVLDSSTISLEAIGQPSMTDKEVS